jgi:hypothetical protein
VGGDHHLVELLAPPAVGHDLDVRGLAGDRELVEQRLEARVVAVVEDDGAGVDVPGALVGLDTDGVRVPAHVVAGLEDRALVLGVQEMGRRQAQGPRPDDRDPHEPMVRLPGRRGSVAHIAQPQPRRLPLVWCAPSARPACA